MRRALPLLALLVFAPARANDRVAYVDLQRALNEVGEGKAETERLRRRFGDKQKLLDERNAAYDSHRREVESGSVANPARARADLDREARELQELFARLQKELKEAEQAATERIYDRMHVLMDALAREGGYEYVVDKQAVAYGSAQRDLTNELVRRYDRVYPAR
jgi:outer membrane protein